MEARRDLLRSAVAQRFSKHINAGAVLTQSSLPTTTSELVKIRASQINGCATCTDMHTGDAERNGETSVRLNLVAAWREATVFTGAERAALGLTEEGTRIADSPVGVGDEARLNAVEHLDEDQLAAVVAQIALINFSNGVSVLTRQPAGDHVPGEWG